MLHVRTRFALCNFKNTQVFASGGNYSDLVGRYEIADDVWQEMPRLMVARCGHSSCAIGDSVYVLCGRTEHDFLNSIERLDTSDLQAGWQLMQLSVGSLRPRDQSVCCALSLNEIVILGGRTTHDALLNDVVVFNTNTERCVTTVQKAHCAFKVQDYS